MAHDISQKLFEALTKEYPAPWHVEYHPGSESDSVSAIRASNGLTPLTLETHSGDGDMWHLRTEGAEALTDFVNAIYAEQKPK